MSNGTTFLPATVTIPDLPVAGSLTGAELLEAVQTTNNIANSVQVSLASVATVVASLQTSTFAFLNVSDQQLSGGVNVTSTSLVAGNILVDCGKCPLQYVNNTGAFTLTAPLLDGSCILLMQNHTGAGVVTFSGFSVGTFAGDSLNTTNGNSFSISIWRINGVSGYRVAAHQ